MATVNQSAYTAKLKAIAFQMGTFMTALYFGIIFFRRDIVDTKNQVQGIGVGDLLPEYDFIIVGSGSAGSVVANRLSENGNWTVLLIEAGGHAPILTNVPILQLKFVRTSIDWQFPSVPTKGYALDQDNLVTLPRGKVLGGTSVLNGLLYCRGNHKDFDNWERLGNPGWCYKDVLPYFKKSEDMRIPELVNSKYHGTGGGFLPVENFRYYSPIAKIILKAAIQMGIKKNDDYNGASQVGASLSQGNVKDGIRCSAARCVLGPVKDRKNLHIILNAFVTKILINKKTKVARGVRFEVDQKNITVKAKKEVILSAGTIQTPQLLMLSGIGPSDHLTQKGIPTIIDLPGVGQNLQNHISMGGIDFLISTPPSASPDAPTVVPPYAFTPRNLYEFLIRRKGILYGPFINEVLAFINTKYNEDPTWPDILLIAISTSANNIIGLTHKQGVFLSGDYFEQVYGPVMYKKAGYEFVPLVVRPKSRGYVKLNNSDPHTKPLLDFNYFSDPDDMKRLVDGANIAYNISKSPALQKLNSKFYDVSIPGCENLAIPSDQYWECLARHFSRSACHAVGTSKMGPVNDTQAVVNSKLLVHGTKNLRVIDASIMPQITTCNTNAATTMIAERGSDFVKQKWAR